MLQDEGDRFAEIRQALFTCFPLTVGAWHFRTVRDVPRAVLLDDGRELIVHFYIVSFGREGIGVISNCLAHAPDRFRFPGKLVQEIGVERWRFWDSALAVKSVQTATPIRSSANAWLSDCGNTGFEVS